MSLNTLPFNPFPPSSDQKGSGGGGSYVLPIASADTLGGVKVGSNLSIEDGVLSAPAPYTPPAYSSTPTKVGTWSDGKDLYRVVVDVGALPNASSKTLDVDTERNIHRVVMATGYTVNPSNGNISFIPYGAIASQYSIELSANSLGKLVVTTGADYSTFLETKIVVYYTVSTESEV